MKFHEMVKLIDTNAHFKGFAKIEASDSFSPKTTAIHIDVTSTAKTILSVPVVQHLDYKVAYPFLKKEGIEKAKVIINVKNERERKELIKNGLVEPTPCSPVVFKTAVENLPKLAEQHNIKISTYHFPDLALLLLYKPEGLVAYAEDRTGEEICKARMSISAVGNDDCPPNYGHCEPAITDLLPEWLNEKEKSKLAFGEEGIIRMLNATKQIIDNNVDVGLIVELLLYKDGNPWYSKAQAVLYGAYLFLIKGGKVLPFESY